MKVSRIAALVLLAFAGLSRAAEPLHLDFLTTAPHDTHNSFLKVGDANGGPGGDGGSGDNSPGARGGDGGNNSGNDSGNNNGTGNGDGDGDGGGDGGA